MAKLDLIDRTALVAELEDLKTILGDVFLGMVVERAIERVKAQPVVEAAPVVKSCGNCKHRAKIVSSLPCRRCDGKSQWEAADA